MWLLDSKMGLLKMERGYFRCFFLCLMIRLAAGNVVLIGKNVSLSFDDIEANFAPEIKESGEYGVLYTAEPLDACDTLKNKVVEGLHLPFVLIIRGGCTFDDKVRAAQRAGFKAAIVYNNEDNSALVSMAGTSGGITIHAVFVTKSSGEVLKKYAERTDVELWIMPTFENSAWSIIAISLITLLALSTVMATCFFVRRYRIRREVPRVTNVRGFHGMSRRLVKSMPSLIFTSVLEDNCTSRMCAVCLEDYNTGEKIRVLPCRHIMAAEQAESSRRGAGKANWTAHQHAIWVEIVHALVLKGHRPGTTLDRNGTAEMMKEFKERTGVEYTKVQFKNHWDSFKKDWGVWKKLLENTGLGWDTEKRTVIAEDEWWTNWLAQDKNAKYARWRQSGLEFQDELDVIFGGTMATGDIARSSAMPSSARSRIHTQGLGTQDESPEDIDVILETQTPIEQSPDTPEAMARSSFPEPSNSRRRKRTGTFDIGDQISRLVDVLDTRTDSSGVTSGGDPSSIVACMKILDGMLELVLGSDLYFFAIDLLASKTMRSAFMAMQSDEIRYSWLIYKQRRQGSGH